MPDILGKTGMNGGDFIEEHFAELDLGREQRRRCTCARLQVQPNICFPDRAQRVSNGAIKRLVGRTANLSHFSAQL